MAIRSTPHATARNNSCAGPAAGGVVNRCCGKDLGPMEDHEAPSQEDIERFSDVTRTCPHCKEDVYDDAELCYHCGEALVQADKPLPIWVVAAGVLVAVGMLLMLLR